MADYKRLLITGTGRCGTHFVQGALDVAGVKAGHEEAFSVVRHGDGDWQAEVSWLAAPYSARYVDDEDTYVVHLWRDPVAYVRSRMARGTFTRLRPNGPYSEELGPWGKYAEKWCPHMMMYSDLAKSGLERAATHWVHWNRMIFANEVIEVIDVMPSDIVRWAGLIGVEVPRPWYRLIEGLDSSITPPSNLPDLEATDTGLVPGVRMEHERLRELSMSHRGLVAQLG